MDSFSAFVHSSTVASSTFAPVNAVAVVESQ